MQKTEENMQTFASLLLASLLFTRLMVDGEISSHGRFYQKVKGDSDEQLAREDAFLTAEFFECKRRQTCSRVIRSEMAKQTSSIGGKGQSEWKLAPFDPRKKDCKDYHDSGNRESGVYNILGPNQKLFEVYCDMETDGGGWTVIQRRVDGSTDFNRNWSDYKHGFGDLGKNMWIGLENMHSLASPGSSTTLRIELKHWTKGDQLFYAKYDSFQIGNEADGYRIRVSEYSGTAGDAFNSIAHHANNEMKFSTKDHDNDMVAHSCAVRFHGGWWYNNCHQCQLNGLFPELPSTNPIYMSWYTIVGFHGDIKYSEMKIRRN